MSERMKIHRTHDFLIAGLSATYPRGAVISFRMDVEEKHLPDAYALSDAFQCDPRAISERAKHGLVSFRVGNTMDDLVRAAERLLEVGGLFNHAVGIYMLDGKEIPCSRFLARTVA